MFEVGRNIFVVLALVLVLVEPGSGYYPWEKVYHIHIQNRMSPTKPSLIVHVKSETSDLKEHTIGPDGEFQFHFRPSFWHKTHFYCVFHCGNKFKEINIFKPGIYKNETEACRRLKQRPLYWRVQDDGFYRSCDDKMYKKLRNWSTIKKSDGTPEKSDEAIEKSDGAPEKSDEAIEKSDGVPEKSDGAIEKSDEAIEKSDGTTEKSDATIEKSDKATEKSDGATEKSDGAIEKSDGATEKSDAAIETSDGTTEKNDGATKKSDGNTEKTDGVN